MAMIAVAVPKAAAVSIIGAISGRTWTGKAQGAPKPRSRGASTAGEASVSRAAARVRRKNSIRRTGDRPVRKPSAVPGTMASTTSTRKRPGSDRSATASIVGTRSVQPLRAAVSVPTISPAALAVATAASAMAGDRRSAWTSRCNTDRPRWS